MGMLEMRQKEDGWESDGREWMATAACLLQKEEEDVGMDVGNRCLLQKKKRTWA